MPENDAVPDPMLIVGAITWDVVDGGRRPGGAATYAARAATALAIRAHVLTAGGADADLDAFAGHELAVVPVEQTMTLAHHVEDETRHQRLIARPGHRLHPRDLPTSWPHPRTIVLGPLLLDDIDVTAFLDEFADDPEVEVALLAQGLQRAVANDGAIEHLDTPSAALIDAARPGVTVCLSAEETAGWSRSDLAALVARSKRVVITYGSAGADIRSARGASITSTHIPALAAEVIDTTGAGDVFATALILAMRAGEDVAGRLAAACAAACVERPGSAPLPARSDLEARAGVTPDWTRAQGDR